jgi:hypothetical protein
MPESRIGFLSKPIRFDSVGDDTRGGERENVKWGDAPGRVHYRRDHRRVFFALGASLRSSRQVLELIMIGRA